MTGLPSDAPVEASESPSGSHGVWQNRLAVIAAVSVALVGATLTLAGWKSRIPSFDVLTTIDAAGQFLASGRLPDRGVLTSFVSFTPPGAAWLVMPGMAAFHDPRLFEYVGSIGLYFAAAAGIFLLTRRYLGSGCALLATALYACSGLGLTAASSVWQRYPIHAFFVWTVYWAARWADDDDARFLGASILTWGCGMYIFMEMAPSIVVIPAFWIARRPSVRLVPVTAAVVLVGLVWLPYLRFEQSRSFIDLRSQVQRFATPPASFADGWCDASLAPPGWQADALRPITSQVPLPAGARLKHWVADRIGLGVTEFLFANFADASRIPGSQVLLLLFAVVGAALLSVVSLVPVFRLPDREIWARWSTRAAVVLLLAGAAFNEFALARVLSGDGELSSGTVLVIRLFQTTLVLAALAIAFGNQLLASAIQRVVSRMATTVNASERNPNLLGLAVLLPWLLLFFVAEFDRRFWWIWPMQVIALAAAVTYVPRRLQMAPWVSRVGSVALVAIVALNTVAVSRLQNWSRDGWAGQDAAEVQVTDRVAALLKGDETSSGSIGYEVNIAKFMAIDNIVDPRYKAGAPLDLLLKYRHGITNADQCAEGFSPGDSYRVREVMDDDESDPAHRFRVAPRIPDEYSLRETVGRYQIFEKQYSFIE